MSSRMTATASATSNVEPRSDELIFRNVAFTADDSPLSRYGDDAWLLRPMSQKATSKPLKVDFLTVPEVFRSSMRRIVWTFINEKTPIGDLTRRTGIRDRPSAGTITQVFLHVRTFFSWLHARGINALCDVTSDEFRAYASHIAQRPTSRENKGVLLFSVTRVWLLSPYLPAADRLCRPTWEDRSNDGEQFTEVIGRAKWSGENKTPPVHPQTMSALLLAAQRVVEVFGPDIIAAVADRSSMRASILPSFSPEQRDIVTSFQQRLESSGGSLPGMRGAHGMKNVEGNYLALEYLAGTLGVGRHALLPLRTCGLPLRMGAPMPTQVTGFVDGQPWCPAIDYYEVEQLKSMLMIACFIVVSYLSGMRVEECRALKRGCCAPVEAGDGAPPHFEIHGRSFKDALDEEGNSIPGGVEREQPWVVLAPVATAIAVAESLHEVEHVFAHSCFNLYRKGRGNGKPATPVAVREGIAMFIAWWNERCAGPGDPHESIPPDPDGKIVPARFRRTLAWFIYRVPGGRIALGIQYGHLRGYTSDGYASRVASGLRDVFPMEEALAVAESLNAAAQRLDDGQQVSGPAAARYIDGVRSFQRTFEGTYLTAKEMTTLRRNPALRIYDNPLRALACVYDQSKALCHPDRDRRRVTVADTPDVTRCQDNCANVARTDAHAELLNEQIESLREEVNSSLTPEPIQIRFSERIDRLEQELSTHERTRRTS
jgi:hypothetical protein